MEKAYSFKRFVAYFIDIMIVSVIASLFTFVLPGQDNITKLNNEYNEITQSYFDGEITSDEYLNRSNLIVYDLDRANVLSYIIQVALIVLYFVVFQFKNKGQTIGKKLMRIRIVSIDDRSLTLNDYLYRAVVFNSVLTDILIIALVLFIAKDYYFYVSFPLQMIQIVLILITIFMVLFKKDGRGLHDKVAHSKVVNAE